MSKIAFLFVSMVLVVIPQPPAARAGEFERYFPDDISGYAYLNWHQISNSAFFRKYVSSSVTQSLADPDTKKLLGLMGIDLMKDIDYVAVGVRPPENHGVVRPPTAGGGFLLDAIRPGIIVIGGRFHPGAIRSGVEAIVAGQKDMAQTIRYGDLTFCEFIVARPDSLNVKLYLTLIGDRQIMMAASRDDIRQAVVRFSRNGAAAFKDTRVAAAIAAIRDNVSFSFYFDRNDIGDLGITDPGIARLLDKLEHGICELNFDSGIRLNIVISMKDSDAAKELQPAFTGIVEQLGLIFKALLVQSPELGPLGGIADSLKVSTRGKDIVVAAECSAEVIEAMRAAGERTR